MAYTLTDNDNDRRSPKVQAVANKFVHLATFGMVWGLANMVVVNFIFDRVYNEDPFPVLQILSAVL